VTSPEILQEKADATGGVATLVETMASPARRFNQSVQR